MTRSSDDRPQNAVDVAKHVVIPKAEDQTAVRVQIGRASCVFFDAFAVLPSVKLNDQASGLAAEIDHT